MFIEDEGPNSAEHDLVLGAVESFVTRVEFHIDIAFGPLEFIVFVIVEVAFVPVLEELSLCEIFVVW